MTDFFIQISTFRNSLELFIADDFVLYYKSKFENKYSWKCLSIQCFKVWIDVLNGLFSRNQQKIRKTTRQLEKIEFRNSKFDKKDIKQTQRRQLNSFKMTSQPSRNRSRWSLDFSKSGRSSTSDLPSPPGYSTSVNALHGEAARQADPSLRAKRSWEIALGPIKQVGQDLTLKVWENLNY